MRDTRPLLLFTTLFKNIAFPSFRLQYVIFGLVCLSHIYHLTRFSSSKLPSFLSLFHLPHHHYDSFVTTGTACTISTNSFVTVLLQSPQACWRIKRKLKLCPLLSESRSLPQSWQHITSITYDLYGLKLIHILWHHLISHLLCLIIDDHFIPSWTYLRWSISNFSLYLKTWNLSLCSQTLYQRHWLLAHSCRQHPILFLDPIFQILVSHSPQYLPTL